MRLRRRHPRPMTRARMDEPAEALVVERCRLGRRMTGVRQRQWIAKAHPGGRIIAQSARFRGQCRDQSERFELIERLQAGGWRYLRDGRRPLLARLVAPAAQATESGRLATRAPGPHGRSSRTTEGRTEWRTLSTPSAIGSAGTADARLRS